MRYTPIAAVTEGMILGRTAYDLQGTALLSHGTVLTSGYISRLKELGYPGLYIRSPLEPEGLDVYEPVRMETRLQAQAVLSGAAKGIELKGASASSVRLDEFRRVAESLVDELLSSTDLLLSVVEIRTFDSYTFVHSVNTCILSVMAGIALGLERAKLLDLAIGALLHDLGKMFVPLEILRKPTSLEPDEVAQVQTHTERGYHILRDQIGLLSAHVAYQHHERCDGSGYPRGLKRDEIIPYAKIVAVADSFDAMTTDRPYSRAMYPDEATGALLKEAPTKYDYQCVVSVTRCVSVYPVGSVVTLETGEVGEVIGATRVFTHVLIIEGARRGQTVNCPDEAEIVRRQSWGAPQER